MQIICQHGYFKFIEEKAGEASDFSSLFGVTLVPKDTYFTFEFLKDAPDFSIAGKTFLGFTATETFEGEPGEVFKENGCVFNLKTGLLSNILTITIKTKLYSVGNMLASEGLLQPGSVTDEGDRVMNYTAWYSRSRAVIYYSEVTFYE